jgi:SAM-dependent methyltransferase
MRLEDGFGGGLDLGVTRARPNGSPGKPLRKRIMLSVDHLHHIRLLELERVLPHFPAGGRVLEIGAGTGRQAAALAERGYDVSAIDIASSSYKEHRLFPVIEYDGLTIPFEDGTFDIVYSSNTLEHVPHLSRMHGEIARVLKPDGASIHLMPSHWWRVWTTLSAPAGALKSLLTGRFVQAAKTLASGVLLFPHGERGNALSELSLFRPAWWLRNFEANGFEVTTVEPVELFYTGWMVAGSGLGFEKRRRLARLLGSASYLYVAKKRAKSDLAE